MYKRKTVKSLLEGKYKEIKLPLRITLATKYLIGKLELMRLRKDGEAADIANVLSVLRELGGGI